LKNMKEIGGYFELEINLIKEYHSHAIKLNSVRNALRYILESRKPEKVYLPLYCCNAVLEPFESLGINYEFYRLTKKMAPANVEIRKNEVLLYINYFGINRKQVIDLTARNKDLIIDNSQAFFEKPFGNEDTFYSPRKFFGVPDGGYLYTNLKLKKGHRQDISYPRFERLLRRFEEDASRAYEIYVASEKSLDWQPIKKMSKLTTAILRSVDYQRVKLIRERNFLYLHSALKAYNQLEVDITELSGPLTYPFLFQEEGLRAHLIRNKIYIPTYWQEVLSRAKKNSFEAKLVYNLVSLPVDQRYDSKDMELIIDKIIRYIKQQRI
jgi:hypothetical protein